MFVVTEKGLTSFRGAVSRKLCNYAAPWFSF